MHSPLRRRLHPFDDEVEPPAHIVLGDLHASPYEIGRLLDPCPLYIQSLRLVLLRILVRTANSGRLKAARFFRPEDLYEFLGFENMEDCVAAWDGKQLRVELERILSDWDAQHGRAISFPPDLTANLSKLSVLVGLAPVEAVVLGLTVLVHTEKLLEEGMGLFGENVTARAVPRIFADVLDIDLKEVEAAFDEQSALMRSGLISFDFRQSNHVKHLIDFITDTFPQRLLVKQDDITAVMAGFVRRSEQPTLKASDFAHVESRLKSFATYFAHALRTGKRGVNALIYGVPGVGKTQFAKLVATELGVELVEISPARINGDPITPVRRMQSYRLAQQFFKNDNTVMLFDECEEVLSSNTGFFGIDNDVGKVQKSWVNMALESNTVPTFWLCNSIQEFDSAYLRRFDMVFEMPMHSRERRRGMVEHVLGNKISESTLSMLAKCKNLSPAMLQKASEVSTVVAQANSCELDGYVIEHVNDQLAAQGYKPIAVAKPISMIELQFSPELVNADMDLAALVKGLANTRQGRLCVYGPPGTGKTAFGKWLADQLGIPHLVYSGSQLLAPIANATEQNIAKVFAHAQREGGLLQFDEVDSFLYERSEVRQSWEVSVVNEMLTQMETFDGIFLASTNRIDALDEASQRRFDLSIKFGYMKPDAAWQLFVQTCEALGFAVDDGLKSRVCRLTNIAQGDFAQVARANAFTGIACAAELTAALERAARLKKQEGPSRPVGFV